MKCQACGYSNYRPAETAVAKAFPVPRSPSEGWVHGYRIISARWFCPVCKRAHYSNGSLVEEPKQRWG